MTGIQYDAELVLVSKQTISAIGAIASKKVAPTGVVKASIVVTSIGTSFTLKIQHSTDDSTFYDNVISKSITAVGVYSLYFKVKSSEGPYVRANFSAVTGDNEIEVLLNGIP